MVMFYCERVGFKREFLEINEIHMHGFKHSVRASPRNGGFRETPQCLSGRRRARRLRWSIKPAREKIKKPLRRIRQVHGLLVNISRVIRSCRSSPAGRTRLYLMPPVSAYATTTFIGQSLYPLRQKPPDPFVDKAPAHANSGRHVGERDPIGDE
jgi:hypothetical protein